jgi:hypothetical protein
MSTQGDTKAFNRGGMKNAGFDAAVRALKLKSSDTICFHDVDVFPDPSFGNYPCVESKEIIHLYGHMHCLGGVVCISVADFEFLGRFAQWDQWGSEDADLMKQARMCTDMRINHSMFYPRFSKISGSFYELDERGQRETGESLQAQLRKKITTPRPANAKLSRQQLPMTTMLVPTYDEMHYSPRVHHFLFFT